MLEAKKERRKRKVRILSPPISSKHYFCTDKTAISETSVVTSPDISFQLAVLKAEIASSKEENIKAENLKLKDKLTRHENN